MMALSAAVAQTAIDSFNPQSDNSIRAVAVQPDGKVLLGGNFTAINSGTTASDRARSRLARVDANGVVDPAFNPGASDIVLTLRLQSDGKILVGGGFTTLASSSRRFLGRLQSNGTLDATFNPNPDDWVRDVAIQPDGRLLVAGAFTNIAGSVRSFLARLNPNGSIDATFDARANAQVNTVLVQPDGRIVAGGFFTSIAGQPRTFLARLTSAGNLDSIFAVADNVVWSLALDTEGRITAGGTFATLSGGPRSRLGRLLAAGGLDTTWNPGADNVVAALSIQADGKTVVGGNFAQLGGQARPFVGRILPNGQLDAPFNLQANSTVYATVLQPDGRLLVAGDFNSLGGVARGRAGRTAASLQLTTQPQSIRGVLGDDITFAVSATGTAPVNYRWRKNGVEIPGATSSSLTLPGVSLADAGDYQAAVSNAWGVLVSSNASLSVRLVANDDLPDAFVITGETNQVLSGHNRSATREPGEPDHEGFTTGASVWWTWRASSSRTVILDTTGSAFDTVLAVYTNSPGGTLETVASDDNGAGQFPNTASRVAFQSVAGTVYFIAVDGKGEEGAIVLNFLPAPVNDAFAARIPLSGAPHYLVASTLGATAELGEPGDAAQASVWWSWTAPAHGTLLLYTRGQSAPLKLGVFTGTAVNGLTAVVPEQSDSFQGRLQAPVRAGSNYVIRASSDTFDVREAEPVFFLDLTFVPLSAVTNDAFANRGVLAGMTNSVRATNVGATREANEPLHANVSGNTSVWWTWRAPGIGVVAFDTAGSSFDTLLAVYTGVLGSLTPVAANNDGPGSQSRVQFPTVAGRDYVIAVDGASGRSGDIVLNLQWVPAPSNDALAAARLMTNSPVYGYNMGATKEANEPLHSQDAGGASVWWRWSAPATRRMVLDTLGSSFNTLLAVYRAGTSFPLVAVAANDDATPAVRQSLLTFNATAGVSYVFAVDGAGGTNGNIVLNLNPAPPNDNFGDALAITGVSGVLQGTTRGATNETQDPVLVDQYGPSVWWRFDAPLNGTMTITVEGPPLLVAIYEGTDLTTLSEVASNERNQQSPGVEFDCAATFPILAGHSYYISVGGRIRDFSFPFVVTPSPVNDAFATRQVIQNTSLPITGTTIGATIEAGEPAHGLQSIWWSWRAPTNGPVILTTLGSSCDTVLSVYTGSAINALTLITRNDDAALWNTIDAPAFDPVSRVRFNAVAGVTYQIAVALAREGAGSVTLNFPDLALETVDDLTRTILDGRTTELSATVKITNLRKTQTGPLRIQLLARPGYSFNERFAGPCYIPTLNAVDELVGTLELSNPNFLGPSSSAASRVTGRCAAPYQEDRWGMGRGLMAVLEEFASGDWQPRDARLLGDGAWPRVRMIFGPIGGVITVNSSLSTFGTRPAYVDVRLGPLAASRLGGAWRVSPQRYGSHGELWSYTNFQSTSATFGVLDTNFAIETVALPGFVAPAARQIELRPGATTPVQLDYAVNPPRLFYDRGFHLSITGTPSTTYRIEGAVTLPHPLTPAFATEVTLQPGPNAIPNATPASTNRLYRALWLQDR
jgi:uncharacterized delta-60 repeat protein